MLTDKKLAELKQTLAYHGANVCYASYAGRFEPMADVTLISREMLRDAVEGLEELQQRRCVGQTRTDNESQ